MFNFLIYADDTTLSSTLNTFNDNIHDQNLEQLLKKELIKIGKWLKINKISLYVVKAKYMIFKNKNIQTLNLKIDNRDIEQVTDLHCFGLIIETNVNWKKHTEKYQMRVLNKLEF